MVTDRHTVWAWGGNAAGQLGLGSRSTQGSNDAGGYGADVAVAGPAHGTLPLPAPPAWVAAPLEVVDSALAGGLGLPVAAACGEEHSLLACRDGSVHAAGSNSAGACGLPLVQLGSTCFAPVARPAGEVVLALVVVVFVLTVPRIDVHDREQLPEIRHQRLCNTRASSGTCMALAYKVQAQDEACPA